MHALDTIKHLNLVHAEDAKKARKAVEDAALALRANPTTETCAAYEKAVQEAARY